MTDDVSAVNFIRSRGLNHRQFEALSDDIEIEHGDILYFCAVGLAKVRFCNVFCHCQKRSKSSLFKRKDNQTENNMLQEKCQLVCELYKNTSVLQMKLTIFHSQFSNNNIHHFANCQKICQ
jgi:hypothetical protein